MSKNPISIGMNIFLMTLSIVSVVLLVASTVFFVIFSGIIDDSVETQAREINKQIVMNFEGYINSVIETAGYIQFASINLDAIRNQVELDELYRTNKEIKKDVVSIFLFDRDGRRVVGPALDFSFGGSVNTAAWFKSALSLKEIFNFSATQDKSVAQDRGEKVISVSKAITFTRNGKTETGILLIELNDDALKDLARKTNLGQYGHLLILNDKGGLLYSSEANGSDMTRYSAPIAAGLFLGSKKATIQNTDMFIDVNTLLYTRWLIVTVSNINEIKNAMTHLAELLVLIFLVAIAGSAVVSGLISLRVSRPLNQLESAMRKVESGDFSTPVLVSGQREIVSLAHSFNQMVMNIQDLMARLVSQQQDKRKLELQVLQNQINPHFLYNTLDSIVYLAEHNRNPEVITTVISLARFFRISISKGELFISVEDEISHVQNYLTIQSIRYSKKFTYSIDIEPEMKIKKVMKLVLQPIVENAIYHGVGDDPGYIQISGHLSDGFLVFKVMNTGYGISEAKVQEMYENMKGSASHKSVGIRNVYQRLKLYYGERATISITSVPDESTTVSLIIPEEIQEPKIL